MRNPDYKPRAEPPSGLAGGKVAKVDRVEWLAIPDHQTAVNALLAGEIDYIEAPPHDLKPLLLADRNISFEVHNTIGAQYVFRWNTRGAAASTTSRCGAPRCTPSTRIASSRA